MAFGTSVVAAGVVDIVLSATAVADVEPAAHGRGAAIARVYQGPAMAEQPDKPVAEELFLGPSQVGFD